MKWYHTILALLLIVVLLWAVVAVQDLTPEVPDSTPVDESQGRDILTNLEDQHRQVNPDMIGVLLVVSDFQCPFCAASADAVERFRTAYSSRFPVEFINYPVHGPLPANAAVCADLQGKFWEYHDLVFENQQFAQAALLGFARSLGLNMSAFTACLSTEGPRQVDADTQLAQMLGVRGTPTFVFISDGKISKIEGRATFEQLVAAAESFNT